MAADRITGHEPAQAAETAVQATLKVSLPTHGVLLSFGQRAARARPRWRGTTWGPNKMMQSAP